MIFIGNFLVLTYQEKIAETDRRHGEFNMIVEATNKDIALGLFRERIIHLRNTKNFFEGDCFIFMIQLLEFDKLPPNIPMMLTYNSTVGDPILPYIGCLVPTNVNDACHIFEWENNRPEIDGEPEKVFISFKADQSIETPKSRSIAQVKQLT